MLGFTRRHFAPTKLAIEGEARLIGANTFDAKGQAAGFFLGTNSIAAGMLNAACMTYQPSGYQKVAQVVRDAKRQRGRGLWH
ncbi:MAG: hypothetical protein LH481_15590 [Burkholderiales bacterium]|nr:hypothetical protein [Burkholderiales bacterium]